MALPIKTTIDDIDTVCKYLSSKPTGATVKEAKSVIESKHLDGRKLSALRMWGFLDENEGRLKVTSRGRDFVKAQAERRSAILAEVIRGCSPYNSIVERAAHLKDQTSTSSNDVAAHWHEHFPSEVGSTDGVLKEQAVTFFQLVHGSGLGQFLLGRRGQPTRVDWDQVKVNTYANGSNVVESAIKEDEGAQQDINKDEAHLADIQSTGSGSLSKDTKETLGQAIFLAHGKNKKPVEQLTKILRQFNIPYKVAVDEPNLGRPIGVKVRETMQTCNCAILVFTADEMFSNDDGEIWRPSENVVHELGACSYLYENRIVIMKEDRVQFPSNYRDIGYIEFSEGSLDAKSMDVLRELIGFGIVKISTG